MSLSHTHEESPTVMLSLWRGMITVPRRPATVVMIQEEVAKYFRLSKFDMVSQCRARSVSRPRQIAMWLCRKLTARSFPDIAMRFGGRDHTTVMYACARIDALRLEEVGVAVACDALLARLGGAGA